MDISSYFRSASKSSVVFNSSESEDGNKSETDVQPNPPKKHCSSSTSKPHSKSDLESEVHLLSCQFHMEADRARKEGSIISQF